MPFEDGRDFLLSLVKASCSWALAKELGTKIPLHLRAAVLNADSAEFSFAGSPCVTLLSQPREQEGSREIPGLSFHPSWYQHRGFPVVESVRPAGVSVTV